jgi:hypothetical protein
MLLAEKACGRGLIKDPAPGDMTREGAKAPHQTAA